MCVWGGRSGCGVCVGGWGGPEWWYVGGEGGGGLECTLCAKCASPWPGLRGAHCTLHFWYCDVREVGYACITPPTRCTL